MKHPEIAALRHILLSGFGASPALSADTLIGSPQTSPSDREVLLSNLSGRTWQDIDANTLETTVFFLPLISVQALAAALPGLLIAAVADALSGENDWSLLEHLLGLLVSDDGNSSVNTAEATSTLSELTDHISSKERNALVMALEWIEQRVSTEAVWVGLPIFIRTAIQALKNMPLAAH